MRKLLVKLYAYILYFYDKKKRRACRAHYSETATWNRKLRKQGILGYNSYINHTSIICDKRTRIGKFTSIARNVMIGTRIHPTNYLTTSPFPYENVRSFTDGLTFPEDKLLHFEVSKPVTIGNDVWIGLNAVIMDGVTIGDGAIVGAGAIVTHDVPPYAIVLGIPARVVRYRFDEETIRRLLRVRWWDQPDDVILSLRMDDVEGCLRKLEQMSR